MQTLDQEEQLAQQLNPAAGRGDEPTADAPDLEEQQKLEQSIQEALKQLISDSELESDSVRRHHVRRCLKAEEFWKGNQHLIWKEREFRWYTPFEKAITDASTADGSAPRFQYVQNIYRSCGLSIIAAISQRLPKVRFQPKSAKSERDIATARAASDVMDVIERNNNLDILSVRSAYLLWTQGLFCAYVRYVVNEDYGTHEEPVMEMSNVLVPDHYLCQNCGYEAQETEVSNGLNPTVDIRCPKCNAPMTDMDFRPAEYFEVPQITGMKTYPNGQELITLYGALNVKLMPTAEKLEHSLYLILVEEQHQAAVRAAYPGKAKKIGAAANGVSATDSMERSARLSLSDSASGNGKGSASPSAKLVTYKRAWLRPALFYNVDDDSVRDELLKRYPKGVKVALADGEFLDARQEKLDQFWKICRPMPGTGMYVDAMGHDVIPMQEQFNDAQNVKAEHVEYGSAPPTIYDARFIKGDALRNRRMAPGEWFPVHPEGANSTVSLEQMVHQPELKIDSNIYSYGKEIWEFTQAISGAMPTIFGAPLQGNDTASGYSMAREQALGKLTLFWRAVKQFWADTSLISVECFRDNRTDDYEQVVEERTSEYRSKYIHLEDLKGNITAHPEADEDFPVSWSEIRENLMQLIKLAPDYAKTLLMMPENAPMFKKFIGNPELQMPAEDDREKQYREIDNLLQMPAGMNQLGQMQTTIQPDLFIDDHDVHVATARAWAVSDKGIEQKKMNPGGYANVMAHIVAHLEAKMQEQGILAQMQAAQAPPPNPGGDPNAPQDPNAQPDAQGEQPQADESKPQTVGDVVEKALPGVGDAVQSIANAPVSQ